MGRVLGGILIFLLGIHLGMNMKQWQFEVEKEMAQGAANPENYSRSPSVIEAPRVETAISENSGQNPAQLKAEFLEALQGDALYSGEAQLARQILKLSHHQLVKLFFTEGVDKLRLFESLDAEASSNAEYALKLSGLLPQIYEDTPQWRSSVQMFVQLWYDFDSESARRFLQEPFHPSMSSDFAELNAKIYAQENPSAVIEAMGNGRMSSEGQRGMASMDAAVNALFKKEGLRAQIEMWKAPNEENRYQMLRSLAHLAGNAGMIQEFAADVARAAPRLNTVAAQNLLTGVFAAYYSRDREMAMEWATSLDLDSEIRSMAHQNFGHQVGYEADITIVQNIMEQENLYSKDFLEALLESWSQKEPEDYAELSRRLPDNTNLTNFASSAPTRNIAEE